MAMVSNTQRDCVSSFDGLKFVCCVVSPQRSERHSSFAPFFRSTRINTHLTPTDMSGTPFRPNDYSRSRIISNLAPSSAPPPSSVSTPDEPVDDPLVNVEKSTWRELDGWLDARRKGSVNGIGSNERAKVKVAVDLRGVNLSGLGWTDQPGLGQQNLLVWVWRQMRACGPIVSGIVSEPS